MTVEIRDNLMLDCGDILLLKDMMHLVFTTDRDNYGSWKQNCINYVVGCNGHIDVWSKHGTL